MVYREMKKGIDIPVLNLAPRHEDVFRSGGIAPSFLTSLDGDEWSVSRLGRFTPGERALGDHWIGG
jgi:hypothetical protein